MFPSLNTVIKKLSENGIVPERTEFLAGDFGVEQMGGSYAPMWFPSHMATLSVHVPRYDPSRIAEVEIGVRSPEFWMKKLEREFGFLSSPSTAPSYREAIECREFGESKDRQAFSEVVSALNLEVALHETPSSFLATQGSRFQSYQLSMKHEAICEVWDRMPVSSEAEDDGSTNSIIAIMARAVERSDRYLSGTMSSDERLEYETKASTYNPRPPRKHFIGIRQYLYGWTCPVLTTVEFMSDRLIGLTFVDVEAVVLNRGGRGIRSGLTLERAISMV